mmetsp:Transcript_4748/g.15580  ORF Transcript_4748/g.15580 Transcript_4748/m.15580 type:complete len:202 (-) Transcript_4748:174-779(-)
MAAQRAKPVSARVPDPRTTPRAKGIAIPRLPSDQFTGAFAFPSSCVCTAASTPPTAIPAPPQVPAILKYGKVLRPAIGISLIGPAQARTLGVGRGVLVLGVPVNSRAAAAGLRPTVRRADGSISLGDVIIAIDETAVDTEADLYRALDKYQPGQTVSLTVVRFVRADDDYNSRGRGRGDEVQEYHQTEAKLRIQLQAIVAA